MATVKLNTSFDFTTGVSNDQHYSVHKQIIDSLNPEDAQTYHYDEPLAAYVAEFEIEKNIYRPSNAFFETPEIVAKDAKRDRDFSFVQLTVDAAEFSPDEAVVAAWQKASFAIDPYRGANKLEYTANTGRIDGFLAVAESPEYAPAFETLGLTATIQQLRADQEAFVEVYQERDKEITVRLTSETMRSIRLKVNSRAHFFFEVLNALLLVNSLVAKDAATEEHLSAVILFIQERLNSLERVLKRKGGGGGETPDTDTEGDTTPDTPEDGGETPDEGGETPDPTPTPDEGGETPDPTPTPDDDEEVVG